MQSVESLFSNSRQHDKMHGGDTLFKCGFCGFVYEDVEAAEECELRCVTRALESAKMHAIMLVKDNVKCRLMPFVTKS